MAKKKAGLTAHEVGVACRTMLGESEGWEDDDLAANRSMAMNYYLGRARGDEGPGRSAVVSMDVADMVEAVLANMVPSFASDSVVQFEANGAEDEEQAQLESDVVNNTVIMENRGFLLFLEALKDALLLKNGIIKVSKLTEKDVRKHRFEGLSNIELAEVLEPGDRERIELMDKSGGDNAWDVSIRVTRTDERIKVESVAPENFTTVANWSSVFLDKCPFTSERHLISRSELISQGFPRSVVAALPAASSARATSTMRNIAKRSEELGGGDRSQELIECFQCYARLDRDGDGIGELLEVWIAGDDSRDPLSIEDVDVTPYASGSPFINPHRFLGYSLFDKLANVQDIKTSGMRQWLDGTANSVVPRTWHVAGAVDVDDLQQARNSGSIACKAPGMIGEFPITDIGPSMSSLLQYMDQVRAERGGASLDLQGANAQIAGDTAQGIERQYSSREQLAGLMTRTLAETLIRTTYLLVHQTMRSQMTGMVRFKRAGEWVETDPRTWPARNRVSVKMGASMNERMRRSANLEKVIAYQWQLMQAGGSDIVVSMDGIHNATVDWARSVALNSPEQYFIDPESPESKKAVAQKAQAAQAQAQAQKQQQDQIMALQMQVHQATLQSEQWKALIETQFKYFDAVLSSEVEEAKLLKDVMAGQLQSVQSAGQSQVVNTGAQAASKQGSGA
jgi:hypothetical protein